MGAVVERAVNGAVETVLAEMLKVVGVKFEELKAQVVLMKRDIMALQREKALKEKENDNIRAKLRYTELKLKYYRQGVEEELQQRASASTLVRIHPSSFHQAQRSSVGVSCTESSPLCSTQTGSSEGPLTRINQVLFCPKEQDIAQSSKDDSPEEDDCEWTITLQPHTEDMDAVVTPPPVKAPTVDPGQQPVDDSLSPDGAPQADSSTLPSSASQQVKQEAEEVICIKEEPEDEQEVMATLLLDCQAQQGHLPESEAVRPWTKDLSLYEEYKLRRNELRRRNLSRRRELEKTLPQPLLADMALGGAAGLSQTGFPISSQHQQPRMPCAATSGSQQRQSSALPQSDSFLNMPAANSVSATLAFLPPSSSSSSPLLLKGPNMATHQHTVTSSSSSSSSSSYPQVSLSQQSISLTDADILL
ncbi:hypothetical protein GBF38_018142 [Nibea albiflora]|uniref:Uncharacterized protein n=1 Tax=Nibea albiflora TaxID=240163 RepID=A0ACB7EG75_NIBAL|nr:hypothetical protein GBF38_018142 [Nibea albiflora]